MSTSSFGQNGYIVTPSALLHREGHASFSFQKKYPDSTVSLLLSPFDWVDASIFYVDISNKDYGNGYKQSYKDKGFTIKFGKEISTDLYLAFGFNDLAGTGLFSSEYVAFTKIKNNLELTAGVGWGNFASGIKLENPFGIISDKFKSRSDIFKGKGGQFDLNNYFSGDDASIFFGSSYMLNKYSKLIIEYDPREIEKNSYVTFADSKTPFNVGFETTKNNLKFKYALLRGNRLSFEIDISSNFLDFKKNKLKKPGAVKNYSDLQKHLAQNNIGLKEIYANKENLVVKVKQNTFFNQTIPEEIIFEAVKKLEKKSSNLIISQSALGMEITESVYFNGEKIVQKKNKIDSEKNKVYKVVERYPIIKNNINPILRTFIAGREGFLFNGLLIEDNLEVIFAENLILLSNLKISLIDNFDELYYPPVDTYPNQVRSDIKRYLNNIGDKPSIGRMELNYFKSFKNKHFFRLSAGIFEEMFSGIGIEYIQWPDKSRWGFGGELFHVQKRDYDFGFGLLDYKNSYFRLNLFHELKVPNLDLTLSYGEYLAGDVGYTFEFSRRFKNGVEFGAFFTLTDVSFEDYGEGSFDKGIKFRIPFSIFGKNNLTNYEWRPLTKDPGALLIKSINLKDELRRFRVN